MSANSASGTSHTFTVTNFKNPYSAAPRSGFTLTTIDSNGCNIESTTTSPTIAVTDWATITVAAIARSDTVTTVQELSTMTASFTIDLPVDSGCKLEIAFPSDQPVTSGLTSVSGTGLFSNAAALSVSTSLQTASMTGCPSNVDSGESATVDLAKLYNAA
jgi:hypothetical protein